MSAKLADIKKASIEQKANDLLSLTTFSKTKIDKQKLYKN
jgi:hypothetical protein